MSFHRVLGIYTNVGKVAQYGNLFPKTSLKRQRQVSIPLLEDPQAEETIQLSHTEGLGWFNAGCLAFGPESLNSH